jgi:adenosine deaminase
MLGIVSPLEHHPQFSSLTAWALAVKADPSLLSNDMISCRVAGGNDQLNLFNWANQFLQTPENLEAATTELCSRLAVEHNVIYLELRFCPTLHTLHGLSERSALDAVQRGFAAVGLPGGVIVCALRTMSPEHWTSMAALAADSPAIGFDVAGFEPGYPLEPMREAIAAAVASPHCGVTVHAAEWPGEPLEGGGCETLANLETALELGVDRVGHALQLSGRPELMNRLKRGGVHVEANPFGNTRLLGGELGGHPIRQFLDAGLSVSMSCDNTLFSGSPAYVHDGGPSRQLATMMEEYGLSCQQLMDMMLAAIDAGFDRGADKAALRERITAGWREVVGARSP